LSGFAALAEQFIAYYINLFEKSEEIIALKLILSNHSSRTGFYLVLNFRSCVWHPLFRLRFICL